jgi:hypothetical protein
MISRTRRIAKGLVALAFLAGCRKVVPDAHPNVPIFPAHTGDSRVVIEPVLFEGETLEDVAHDGISTLLVLTIEGVNAEDPMALTVVGRARVRVYRSGVLLHTHVIEGAWSHAGFRSSALDRDWPCSRCRDYARQPDGSIEALLLTSLGSTGPEDRSVRFSPPFDRFEVSSEIRPSVEPEPYREGPVPEPDDRPSDPRITRFDVATVERWWPNVRWRVHPAYREIHYFRANLDGHSFEYKTDQRREEWLAFMDGMRGDPGFWFVLGDESGRGPLMTLYRARLAD